SLEGTGDSLKIKLSDALSLAVPAARVARYRAHVGKPGLLFGLRPEHLTETRQHLEADMQTFDAKLDVTEPMGMETLVYFTLNGVDVCGRVNPNSGARD